jgi:hypothetical protein
MSQLAIFVFAWYGCNMAIWDVLRLLGIKTVQAGWIWKGDLKAGLVDLFVIGASFYATWYLLRHSLKKVLAEEKASRTNVQG